MLAHERRGDRRRRHSCSRNGQPFERGLDGVRIGISSLDGDSSRWCLSRAVAQCVA